jgi:hypothetical protein
MKKLDICKIAKALGAERHGKVRAKGGYFGSDGRFSPMSRRGARGRSVQMERSFDLLLVVMLRTDNVSPQSTCIGIRE